MDFKIRISEPALADLEQIIEYSWAYFPASAERFGAAILNHVELLGRFPYIGSPISGRPRVRQLVHTPILIFYRIHEERCLASTILPGQRQLFFPIGDNYSQRSLPL